MAGARVEIDAPLIVRDQIEARAEHPDVDAPERGRLVEGVERIHVGTVEALERGADVLAEHLGRHELMVERMRRGRQRQRAPAMKWVYGEQGAGPGWHDTWFDLAKS